MKSNYILMFLISSVFSLNAYIWETIVDLLKSRTVVVSNGNNVTIIQNDSSKHTIQGSNKLLSKQIDLPGTIDSLSIRHFGNCTVTSGQKSELTITADDNIIEQVKAELAAQKLSLYLKSGSYKNCTVKYDLIVPVLPQEVKATGTASITIDHAETQNNIRIKGSGASSVTINSGKFAFFVAALSGVAKLNAQQVTAREADISVSGAASCKIGDVEKMKAHASGVAQIRHKGNPDFISKHIDGLGSIEPW